MAAPWRKFAKLAITTGIAIIGLAPWSMARAEIDLNRLVFPKVPSSSAAPAEADDPPPQLPDKQDKQNAEQKRQPAHTASRPENRRTIPTRNVPASYQTSGTGYQSSPTSGSDQAVRRNTPNGAASNPQSAGLGYGEIKSNGSRYSNGMTYGNGGYNPGAPSYGQSMSGPPMNGQAKAPWSVANMLGMEQRPQSGARMASMAPGAAPQSVMQGGMQNGFPPGSVISDRVVSSGTAPLAAPNSGTRTAVRSDAVYLDSEPIAPGAMRSGGSMNAPLMSGSQTSGSPMMSAPMPSGSMMMDGSPMMMEGGPMMGHSPDGFSSPYCNDCNGGHPGCGCGHGGGGWFGGMSGENGSSCTSCGECSGCEEGCGQCKSCPYGRPWILAPLDFIVYELSPPGDGGWWWGENFSVFGGVHDFKSPVNLLGQSNFGTQEGVNWALPLWAEVGLGAQIGVGITQSNFQDTGFVFDDYRNQTFVTGGLFHRPACGQGLQFGLAFDWLHDEFYDDFDVAQLRGEISWLMDCRNEIGFWFATGVVDDRVNRQFLSPATFEIIDQYAFFYRRRFCQGGDARIWGGFTGQDAGLIGVDFSVPIAKCWSIEANCNYVITDHHTQGLTDESWNLGMNLVWSWGCNACCRNAYRPLFNVADNGSLMTRVIDRSQLTSF